MRDLLGNVESAPSDSSEWANRWIDLTQPRLGTAVVFATDEFFGAKERLIDPAEPAFIPGKYDQNGKWMDGWESRRRRDAGHDYCVIRFGQPGIIKGVEISTQHFTGNYPPAVSLEWTDSNADVPEESAWRSLIEPRAIGGDGRVCIPVELAAAVTHVRFHIHPDGGVARLRIFGRATRSLTPEQRVDLAAMQNGALPIAANNAHFGRVSNLLAPGQALNMGDGWETRRRREPGYDWAIVALAQPGVLDEIEIDTSHFKGNYPDRCSIQAGPDAPLHPRTLVTQSMFWPIILSEQPLRADTRHCFINELQRHAPVRFLRINIIPDGGIARLRAWGKAVSC